MTRVPAYFGPRDGGKSIWPASCPIKREKCRDGIEACRWMHSRTPEDQHGNTMVLCDAPTEGNVKL